MPYSDITVKSGIAVLFLGILQTIIFNQKYENSVPSVI